MPGQRSAQPIAQRRPEGAFDAVAASWTIGSEKDGPRHPASVWYDFACAYVDMKWKPASAKYRKDIARALTSATPVLVAEGSGAPGTARIRRALMRWGFNAKQRGDAPADVAAVLAWVARNSSPVSAVSEPAAVDGCWKRRLLASTARRPLPAPRVATGSSWPTRWTDKRRSDHNGLCSSTGRYTEAC